MLARYETELPFVEGALNAVRAMSPSFPLAVASSSNRPLIDAVLVAGGITHCFEATVSSEEVTRGKPSPDVYLEAARRLGVPPERCVAIEDSANGIRAAARAQMSVIAYPNRKYPPDAKALLLADAVIESLTELTAAVAMIRDRS
jgi:HAD superfamily hydrolase (TIGR01509 family)